MDALASALHATFGYTAFRPLQREIMEACLAGEDVVALLPTGGGKSLCYQLPALLRPGLTVVVSPLIALMKDQVDQLVAAGVPATFVNSSLDAEGARSRLRDLHRGAYRLLYVSPERLFVDGWDQRLRDWKVSGVAVDEAHCISAWGHDFRPEYRQLAKLRELLPGVPVMALTATATERVRDDIVAQLGLREPRVFVGSFNRPNLTYRVTARDQPLRQVRAFLMERGADDAGIIYCASRAGTERVAEGLAKLGIKAEAYHAGLDTATRDGVQERFQRDETRVVAATVAFGMGVNKPNVRWVIHHDLPKNVEGYYQETGRAGRDGLRADCLLLFSPGDVARQRVFLDELTDPVERRRSEDQLRRLVAYAETGRCRRVDLLEYFGEAYEGSSPAGGCAGCDNCLEPREEYDGTVDAQKLLSCVYRVRRASRFGTGLNHVIEVLRGSKAEKVVQWGHDQLSTWGIGKDKPQAEWAAIGRELLRLGHLALDDGEFPTVYLTESGAEVLKTRAPVRLVKPIVKRSHAAPARSAAAADLGDDDRRLFERLRAARARLAAEQGVPAYIVCGDATLRDLAQRRPRTLEALRGITGLGESRIAKYGEALLEACASG